MFIVNNIRRNLVKNHYQQLLVALCKMQSIIKIKVTLTKIRKNIAQRTIVSSMKQYQQKMIRYRRQEQLKAKVMENEIIINLQKKLQFEKQQEIEAIQQIMLAQKQQEIEEIRQTMLAQKQQEITSNNNK